MLALLVFIGFSALINAAVLPEVRIQGGSLATISEAPWQVALLYDYDNVGIFNQFCGGAIISRTAVISAAQCTHRSSPYQWKVRVGSSYHKTGGEVISVISYKEHESFDYNNLLNDIVILYLNAQITLGTTAVIVTLPAQGSTILVGSNCTMTGWGRLKESGEIPSQLNKVNLPIANQDQCSSSYSAFTVVTSNMICAGDMNFGGAGPCQGDTGGPLTHDGVLVGISSYEIGCGDPKFPGVFTRVAMYRTWINNN